MPQLDPHRSGSRVEHATLVHRHRREALQHLQAREFDPGDAERGAGSSSALRRCASSLGSA